jgi:carboxymethylenebutenolidase
VDLAAKLKVPVLGLYGAKDTGITQEHVERMRKALQDAGNTSSRIDVFADSGHGFLADYRDSYNEKDAKEAWDHALAWLRQHGAG